ncbi:MAG: NAD-dependent epimerase/dehydratase family protein [Paludibacter sp.]|nr:NAD-dependent epimerase/dehydratase family protein [Paludibacter sp.]
MKVLVTGANGLLGHHVVMELIEQGRSVKIIVRSKENIHFDLNRVETVIGNFIDYETLKFAAQDCDAIIHIGAVTATNLLYYEDYRHVNTSGSATVIQVANDCRINSIVFISTANTIGFGTKYCLSDENSPIQFPFSKSFYARSKAEAEKLFTEASKNSGKHIIIINPTFMIGDYDVKPSSGKLMLMSYKKKFIFVPSGGKDFVSVKAVATAVCNALEGGRNGERYLFSGRNMSFAEFYELQSRVGDYEQKIITVPDFLLEMAAKFGDLLRLFGVKTDLCSMNINQLLIQEFYSNKKAVAELQLPEYKIEDAIGEALKWFKTNKYV